MATWSNTIITTLCSWMWIFCALGICKNAMHKVVFILSLKLRRMPQYWKCSFARTDDAQRLLFANYWRGCTPPAMPETHAEHKAQTRYDGNNSQVLAHPPVSVLYTDLPLYLCLRWRCSSLRAMIVSERVVVFQSLLCSTGVLSYRGILPETEGMTNTTYFKTHSAVTVLQEAARSSSVSSSSLPVLTANGLAASGSAKGLLSKPLIA